MKKYSPRLLELVDRSCLEVKEEEEEERIVLSRQEPSRGTASIVDRGDWRLETVTVWRNTLSGFLPTSFSYPVLARPTTTGQIRSEPAFYHITTSYLSNH